MNDGVAAVSSGDGRIDLFWVDDARALVHRWFPASVADTLDPATLAAQRCVIVDATTPALAREEIDRLRAGLDPAWQVEDRRLVRTFAFATFSAAFGLATRVALLAESQGHHPSVEVAWGRLTVTCTTDSIGALTANDLIMAAKVDRLVDRGLAIKDGG